MTTWLIALTVLVIINMITIAFLLVTARNNTAAIEAHSEAIDAHTQALTKITAVLARDAVTVSATTKVTGAKVVDYPNPSNGGNPPLWAK